MAQRRIGQEKLRLNHSDERRRSSLDEIDGLIDWAPLAQALSGVYAAAKGEPAWPPLALFKALLLAVWYDLSDVKLAEALDDRGGVFFAHGATHRIKGGCIGADSTTAGCTSGTLSNVTAATARGSADLHRQRANARQSHNGFFPAQAGRPESLSRVDSRRRGL